MFYKKIGKYPILVCMFLAISACDNVRYKDSVQRRLNSYAADICFQLNFDPSIAAADKDAYKQRQIRHKEVLALFSELGMLESRDNDVFISDFGRKYWHQGAGFCFDRHVTVHDIIDVSKAAGGEINLIHYTSSLDYVADWATDPRFSFYYGTSVFSAGRLYRGSVSPGMGVMRSSARSGIYIKDYQLKDYYDKK